MNETTKIHNLVLGEVKRFLETAGQSRGHDGHLAQILLNNLQQSAASANPPQQVPQAPAEPTG
jgi:hypothetical protein